MATQFDTDSRITALVEYAQANGAHSVRDDDKGQVRFVDIKAVANGDLYVAFTIRLTRGRGPYNKGQKVVAHEYYWAGDSMGYDADIQSRRVTLAQIEDYIYNNY